MKRLVWLLLAVFGTALAQVSPVDIGLAQQETCSCCEQPGACGMPDCMPPAAPATQPVFTLTSPAVATRIAAKPARAAREVREIFLASFLPRTAGASAWPVSVIAEMPLGIPLYQEHCSLLL
ncbi:MAG: hypothetical protein WCR49_01825 [Opitutae bacterium]